MQNHRRRTRKLWLLAASAALAAASPLYADSTWFGVNSDWNTAANWNPFGVPNSATTPVDFTNSGTTTVNISASVAVQSLTFTNTSGTYDLSTSAGQTLTTSAITIAPGTSAATNITLTSVATGNLLFALGQNLTITDNSAFSVGLLLGASTVIGTPGNGGVIFTGTSITEFVGSFAAAGSPNNQVQGGLIQDGPGTLEFAGSGVNLIGGLTLNGGTLRLDYSSNTASKLGSGILTLDGGTLRFSANSVTHVTQTFLNGVIIGAGHTEILSSDPGTFTFAAGAIARNFAGTADFNPVSATSAFNITTSAGTVNSLLGSGPAYATVNNGATWASTAAGAIAGLATYGANVYAAGTNTDVTTPATVGAITTNSLRFNTGDQTLNINPAATVTLQSGGILATPSALGGIITGGSISASGGGELLFHVYSNIDGLTVNSALISSVGLTKTGPAFLTLGGNNTGLTGPININLGGLIVTAPAAVNSSSQINFNDNDVGTGLQQFTVDLGNNINGTINPPIRLSAFSAFYGTAFTTGTSTGSRVTLAGAISSAPGLTTPIVFSGSLLDTGGFNLTGNNTFTGNIYLFQGYLGITSDSSLGNPANILNLGVGDNTNGGLVFLNSGITIAHPVTLTALTRIVSNGTDSNIISSPISGSGSLLKDGTGTLTLANPANSFVGGISVNGGTLSLGSTGALVHGTNISVAQGATFTPGTTSSSLFLNSFSLYGGTFRVTSSGNGIIINQITIGPAGGTFDWTASSSYAVVIEGVGAGITINGSSTWLLSPGSLSAIVNDNSATVPITIQPGVTLNNPIPLGQGGTVGFLISGGGTLFQNSDPGSTLNEMNAPITVAAASQFRLTDAASSNGFGDFGTGNFTLDGGTFSYGGASNFTAKPIALTNNGGIIQIESFSTALTAGGAITGPGPLTKTGPGTLILANAANSFTSLIINAGNLLTANDATLGSGPVTLSAAAILTYTASTATARTFNLNSGTLVASAGTLSLNAATINGGFLRGAGTFALNNNSTLNAVTTFSSATLTQTGTATVNNFTNGGTANVNGILFLNAGTNTTSGIINVNNNLAASDFTNNGVINIAQGGALSNAISNLFLGGGARLYIGTKAAPGGNLILQGATTLEVNGALLVNDGAITGTTDVNFGGQAQGLGSFGTVNVTFGGLYQPGFAAASLPGNGATITGLAGTGTIDNATAGGNMNLTLTGNSVSTFSGPIQNSTGSLSLLIQGTSTLTILNTPIVGGGFSANTYTGGTTLTGGATLLVNNINGSATGTGNVILNGGTLGGYGSISGAVIAGTAAHTIFPSAGLPTGSTGKLTLGSLTTNTNTTLAFNLLTPGPASVNDSITIPTANSLTLNGGNLQIAANNTGPASLGFYKAIQYTGAIQGAGIASITLPPITNSISYILDTQHDPGFIDIHRGFIGDANDDGLVNFSDFVLLSNHFGKPNQGWSGADFNNDGTTNFSDFVLLSNNFGHTATGANELSPSDIAQFQSETANFSAPTSVPEPASIALLILAVPLLSTRKTTAIKKSHLTHPKKA